MGSFISDKTTSNGLSEIAFSPSSGFSINFGLADPVKTSAKSLPPKSGSSVFKSVSTQGTLASDAAFALKWAPSILREATKTNSPST